MTDDGRRRTDDPSTSSGQAEDGRYASVAEMADAQGLGPCVRKDVEVRLLSLAILQ